MNKLAVFALFAAVALVAADNDVDDIDDEMSQIALATNDDVERSYLPDEMKVFNEFCTESRDFIFTDIKNNADDVASKAFATLFNLAESLGQEALSALQTGNKRLTEQIANPDSPIAKADGAIEAILAEGQQAVKDAQTAPQSFIAAFKSMVAATSSAAYNAYQEKLNNIMELLTTFGSISTLEQICNKVHDYETQLQASFSDYKEKVAATAPQLGVAELTLNKVPCVTATRVIRVNGVCQFAKSAAPAIQKLWATRASPAIKA